MSKRIGESKHWGRRFSQAPGPKNSYAALSKHANHSELLSFDDYGSLHSGRCSMPNDPAVITSVIKLLEKLRNDIRAEEDAAEPDWSGEA
jgi:hypothetical protein